MNTKPKIVVFTGAGVSADSGISTFRDSDGLWASYRIEDVCTPEALARNRSQVIDFYNIRRKELLSKMPNAGHDALVKLEQMYEVQIITQNIDDLHERAGSSNILHLHGELRKLRSSIDQNAIIDFMEEEQPLDARHADGSLLRPHVVFFGESVPMFEIAQKMVEQADVLLIVGTSLAVYPAALLVGYARPEASLYLVDPGEPSISRGLKDRVIHIKENSALGLPRLVDELIAARNN